MHISVTYPTLERRYINRYVFQHVTKDITVDPLKVIRHPCGIGADSKRYYYEVIYKAQEDAAFVHDGSCRTYVNRKRNPQFNPKKLEFVDNVWTNTTA
jgi:hypothetical protein